jgi:hypothetical protein
MKLLLRSFLVAMLVVSGCRDKKSNQQSSSGMTSANEQTKFNTAEEEQAYKVAFEATLWAMPAIGINSLRRGFLEMEGSGDNTINSYSKTLISRHKAITSNNATPYITAFSDIQDGPVVLVLPAETDKGTLYGQVMDAWQHTIADVGPAGMDGGKGGKYLILPPGYDRSQAPESDYFIIPSTSNRISLVFRSVRKNGATEEDAYNYSQLLEMYPYAEEGKNPVTNRFDPFPVPLRSLPVYDLTLLEDISDIVNNEPVKERDKVMMAKLETIGIQKGQAFKAPEHLKKALIEGVQDANAHMHDLVWKLHNDNLYWPDRNWCMVMIPDSEGGFDFVTDGKVEIEKRAAAWNFFTIYPNKLTENPGTVYLAPVADKDGNVLEAGKTYKVNVPPNMPAKQFWSITVYDEATWAFNDNPENVNGLGTFQLDKMVKNDNGSVDIYIGPKAPEGLSNNWIPTFNTRPYIWLRLYGPTEAFLNKSFVMPDFELVE